MTDDAKPTVDDVLSSMTGFEEHAMRQTMNVRPYSLSDGPDSMELLRGLAFVLKRREGLDDAPAREAAMTLTANEINDLFGEDNEPLPDDPITDAGKGVSVTETQPTLSPDSVSLPESHLVSIQP